MKEKTTGEIFKQAHKKQGRSTRELAFQVAVRESNVKKQMTDTNPKLNTVMKFIRCFGMKLIIETKEGKQYKIK